jgi:hypothetical protein
MSLRSTDFPQAQEGMTPTNAISSSRIGLSRAVCRFQQYMDGFGGLILLSQMNGAIGRLPFKAGYALTCLFALSLAIYHQILRQPECLGMWA